MTGGSLICVEVLLYPLCISYLIKLTKINSLCQFCFYFIKQVITHYEQLKARVIHHGLLVDNLIYKVHL